MSKNQKNNFLQQVSDKETKIILELAESALNFEGDFCEFGCYRGDTSLLLERLLEKNPSFKKQLWIYDSFAGLPAKTREDSSAAGEEFQAGELLISKKEVVERFKKAGLHLPRIKKAFFEDLDKSTNSPDLAQSIAFAFLDGDLYQSIKTSLELCLPRMSKNSILVVHDYNNPQLPGVAKAVEEKLSLRPERRESLAIFRFN